MTDKKEVAEEKTVSTEVVAEKVKPQEKVSVAVEESETPKEAKAKKTPSVKVPKVKVASSGGMSKSVDGMSKNVKMMTDTMMDAEKRKHFLTHPDMEPHRHLAGLLGLTALITLALALLGI